MANQYNDDINQGIQGHIPRSPAISPAVQGHMPRSSAISPAAQGHMPRSPAYPPAQRPTIPQAQSIQMLPDISQQTGGIPVGRASGTSQNTQPGIAERISSAYQESGIPGAYGQIGLEGYRLVQPVAKPIRKMLAGIGEEVPQVLVGQDAKLSSQTDTQQAGTQQADTQQAGTQQAGTQQAGTQQQGGPAIPGLGQGATPTDKFRTQTKSHGERLYGYLPKNAAEVGEYGLASYSNRQGGATLQGFDEDISKYGLTSLAPSYMGMSSEQEANLPLDQRVARSQGGLGTARAAMAQYQQGSLKDIEEMRAQVSAGLGAHQQEMQQVKQQRMMAKLQSMMQTPLGQKEVAKMAQKTYDQALSDARGQGFSGPAALKLANDRVASFWQGINQAGQNQGRVTESAADVLGGISVGAQRNRSDAALAQQESALEQYNANQQLERDKALETHKANLPGKNRGLSEKEIEKEKLDIRKRLALGEFSIEEAEALEAAIESVSGGSGGIGGQSTNPSASAYIKKAMESGATDAQARAAAKEQIANGRLQDDLS